MVDLLRCPKCESHVVWRYGLYMTNEGKRQKYRCCICGHIWSKKINV